MISCAEAVRHLWEYLEHDLDSVDHAQVEEHLAVCRRCCGEAEFAGALREFMTSAAPPELPVEAEARLTGFLDALEKETP
ncbi:MAG: zf-HC2 domain-containing protein [Actinomycetota bacterium]